MLAAFCASLSFAFVSAAFLLTTINSVSCATKASPGFCPSNLARLLVTESIAVWVSSDPF